MTNITSRNQNETTLAGRLRAALSAPNLAFIAVVGVVILAALPVLAYPMGRDQGMYANIGLSILNGGTPYRDMWDIKPPPIYYLYAGAIGLFGQTTWAVHMLDFIFVPITMYALYRIGLRVMSRQGALLAAALFGVFYFNEQFASLSQSDSLVTMPMALAVLFAYRASEAASGTRRAWIDSFMVGALCGLVLWFKHYYAFFVVALVVNQIIARRRFPLQDGLAFAAGGLVTGGSLLVYFASIGIVQEMLIVSQGTAAYNAQGYDFNTFLASMWNYIGFRWQHWHAVMALALLWFPVRLTNPRLIKKSSLRLVWLWLAAGLAFVFIQAKGFDTHWIPMLPGLCLLAADTLDRLLTRTLNRIPPVLLRGFMGGRLPAVITAFLIIGILSVPVQSVWAPFWPYLTGNQTLIRYYENFQANDVKPAEDLRVVRYLERNTTRGDSIFIWGFRPQVAYMAGLRPATRYQAQFPLVAEWYPPEWRQQNVDVLWAALPPYVLVMQADWMPWVTGRDQDSHELLVEYEPLNSWLIYNYEFDREMGDFLIWKRKSAS